MPFFSCFHSFLLLLIMIDVGLKYIIFYGISCFVTYIFSFLLWITSVHCCTLIRARYAPLISINMCRFLGIVESNEQMRVHIARVFFVWKFIVNCLSIWLLFSEKLTLLLAQLHATNQYYEQMTEWLIIRQS